MHANKRAAVLTLGLLALLVAVAPSRTSAQTAPTRPIFLALPESFPQIDARAVLLREPGRDIVLLKEGDASPETLQVALNVLRRMDRDHPLGTDRGQVVPITGFVFHDGLDPDRRASLEVVLAELEARPPANVGNLGWGRWMSYPDR